MNKSRLTRRAAATIGVAAAISAGALTACGGGGSGGTSGTSGTTTTTTATTTTTTTAVPSASPTEKSINPTGGNLFTPPVLAPGPPTVTPGDHSHTGGG